MPVTPFHLGPALVLKAIGPRRFSLGAFTLVQGIIDIESVTNILLGQWPVHDRLHTFVGAMAVATGVAVIGRPLLDLVYRVAARRARGWYRDQLAVPDRLAVVLGALAGGVLHVVPDAMMHPDLQPFAPWSRKNPFLFDWGFELVHLACLLIGVVGWRAWRSRRTLCSTPSVDGDRTHE